MRASFDISLRVEAILEINPFRLKNKNKYSFFMNTLVQISLPVLIDKYVEKLYKSYSSASKHEYLHTTFVVLTIIELICNQLQ